MAKSSPKNIYNHKTIEPKWQEKWSDSATNHPVEMFPAENKFYNLWMFPYPSAEGLHAGHAFASTGSDIYGRFKRMHGYEVFQPIGYDSFGIHSENFALKIGELPQEMLKRTTKKYAEQLKSLGHGYDWTRTVTTSDIDYYRWTQWLFLEMFKAGLAYRKSATVNWCPSCKTVLADEQVMTPRQAGKLPPGYNSLDEVPEGITVCERCGSVVEKKELEQWFFRITDYADKLLVNLGKIDWPEKIKTAQRNWIGKKEGINITYPVRTNNQQPTTNNLSITVWTSRPDTNFGATFIVVAPEYSKLKEITTKEHNQEVSEYIKVSQKKTKEERIAEGREKTGVFTGSYAINHLTGREMPIYVADFVLTDVGTGAVVGVPGHDMRDFEFSVKFKLPIKIVVKRNTNIARSFLMGASEISDKELTDLGITIAGKSDSGARKIEIPISVLPQYEELVHAKMTPGFWNDYIGEEAVFIFKHKDGTLERYILNDETEQKIDELAEKFVGENLSKGEISVWRWLAENEWYKPYIIQEEDGTMINSDFLNGMDIHEATQKIMDYIVEKGWGERVNNYHLRDWLVSRQRYWGPPIPMVHCEKCAKEMKSYFNQSQITNHQSLIHSDQSDWNSAGWFPVPDLPVQLPLIKDYQPEGSGKGPLAKHPEFYKTTCPNCGGEAVRETDVSDTFVDSAWYFLRYPTVSADDADKVPFNEKITKAWLPVDLYFGGAEHSVLHLMYCRFTTMVLNDLGLVPFEEPCPRFFAHGLMIKDGAKMSKSRGNVVNPDEYIEKFGADTLRLYLMFMGPMDGYPDFRDTGIEGMYRFVRRVWELLANNNEVPLSDEQKSSLQTRLHQTIKKVTEDIEGFRYNTAISAIMELVGTMKEISNSSIVDIHQSPITNHKSPADRSGTSESNIWFDARKTLTQLLAPFAPHLTEEVWVNYLGEEFSIHRANWPVHDPALIVETMVNIVVQVNGKLRGTIKMAKDKANDKDTVLSTAKSEDSVAKWLTGKELKKEIFIPGKLVNFVIS